jgi:hypothetical protein
VISALDSVKENVHIGKIKNKTTNNKLINITKIFPFVLILIILPFGIDHYFKVSESIMSSCWKCIYFIIILLFVIANDDGALSDIIKTFINKKNIS